MQPSAAKWLHPRSEIVRRKRKRVTEVRLQLRLYPGQDDDLIEWLTQLDGCYGVKSQAAKGLLRQSIRGGERGQPAPVPTVDLAEIRRVVEAAVAQALARFEGQVARAAPAAPLDDETEALLDSLEAALVLGDDK